MKEPLGEKNREAVFISRYSKGDRPTDYRNLKSIH